MKLKVAFEPSEEGGYTETLEEALVNIREAISLHLEEDEPFQVPEKASVMEIVELQLFPACRLLLLLRRLNGPVGKSVDRNVARFAYKNLPVEKCQSSRFRPTGP